MTGWSTCDNDESGTWRPILALPGPDILATTLVAHRSIVSQSHGAIDFTRVDLARIVVKKLVEWSEYSGGAVW